MARLTTVTKISESKLQQACVNWFRMKYSKKRILLFSIPNGAHLHGSSKAKAMQWKKLEREGAVKGVADLFLSISSGNYNGLYIEMKTTAKSSKQSQTQKDFEKEVLKEGFGYAMPRTFDEFVKVVESYFENGTY